MPFMPRLGRYVRGRFVVNRAKTRRAQALIRSRKALGKSRLSKLVQRIVNRGTEVKHVGQEVINANFNQTISAPSECYRIMPSVTEGTDGHQRIGDKIRPKWLVVKGHIHYNKDAAGNYIPPNTIRVLILTQKNLKTNTQLSNVSTGALLKDNIGTDVARGYVGGQFDNLAPINKDLFKVHMDRKFKLKAQLYAELGNAGQSKWLDGTTRTVSFTKKIRCPRNLSFDDIHGDNPNNFAPFFCMGGVNDDNNTPFTLTSIYHVTVLSELYFTDA